MSIDIIPPRIPPSQLELGRDAVEGWGRIGVTAIIEAQPAVAPQEELWNGNSPGTLGGVQGDRVLPTSAAVVSIVSNNLNDTIAGTGAQRVNIRGLDATGALIQESVDMNGTTPVVTTLTFFRTLSATVTQVGSTDSNVGTVDASISGNIQERIEPTRDRSQGSHFSVPLGMNAEIFDLSASVAATNQDGRGILRQFRSNLFTPIQFPSGTITLDTASDPSFQQASASPIVLDPLTDLKFTVENDATQGMSILLNYTAILAPKGSASNLFPPSP